MTPGEYGRREAEKLQDSKWMADAIEYIRIRVEQSVREAVGDERKRAAEVAWKMQSTQFGGGTAIGNAIADGVDPEKLTWPAS